MKKVQPCASAMGKSAGTVQEGRMENYKNCKTGQETARKYADILHMERPQSEESL